MNELAVRVEQCSKCPRTGNVWNINGVWLCYQCMMAGKAPSGSLWANARTQRTVTPERTFASATEARCAEWLQFRERAGEISDLEYQVVYVLAEPVKGVHRGVRVVIDFRFEEGFCKTILDAKAVGKPDKKHSKPWYVSLSACARVKYIWLESKTGLHVNLWPPLEGA